MITTLVLQSHRCPLPFDWLRYCLDTVEQWASDNDFDYRLIGDEFFDLVDHDLLVRTAAQIVVATDLARLLWLQRGLAQGYATVIWCDADFLVFNPGGLLLPGTDFALGREVWVQRDAKAGLRVYPKLHNAFMMFRRGNSFLDFYLDTATRLLRLNQGGMPAQFIGPKLLTALHNIARLPVMENAGMLSPLVMRDLLAGQGPALKLFHDKSPAPLDGANLSGSLYRSEGFTEAEMEQLIESLVASKGTLRRGQI